MRRADKLVIFMCQIVLKSGSLNLLEPSGPVIGLLYLLRPVLSQNNYVNSGHKQHVSFHVHHTAIKYLNPYIRILTLILFKDLALTAQ